MILIAGGTGRLGAQVVRALAARGAKLRVLTRDATRAAAFVSDGLAEVAVGDVRDAGAVERAVEGARTVVSAMHGFSGARDVDPRSVDLRGNENLIRASARAGVEHFVLVSVHGAAPEHPIELFQMKHLAEQALHASGLQSTILRPTAFMETWLSLVAAPLLSAHKTMLFGRGDNPINFVSAFDVARAVELAVTDPTMRGRAIEVGGPENLSMSQLVTTFQDVTRATGSVRRVPLPVMRAMSVLMRPLVPHVARQIRAGVVMDTADMTFDAAQHASPFARSTLREAIRREYGATTPVSR